MADPDGLEDFVGFLVNGITLGAIYALIAVGYTMVYGIIKLINFAHGEIFMFGTFFGLVLVNEKGIHLSFAIVAAMVGCIAIGVLLDWNAYLPLRRNKRLPDVVSTVGILALGATALLYFLVVREAKMSGPAAVLAAGALVVVPAVLLVAALLETFGLLGPPRRIFASNRLSALITAIDMSLLLQTMAMLIWGPDYHSFRDAGLPAVLNQPVFEIPFVHYAVLGKEVAVWAAALFLMVFLNVIVQHTKVGRAMRACSQDKDTAALMGVDVNRIIMLTFVIGSAMAAVAGILYAVKVGGNISFRMGYYPGVIAFAAAVLGGIGNIKGAMLGGLILGLTQGLCSGYISSDYDFAFAFGVMVLMILVRPWGLLGKPSAARA